LRGEKNEEHLLDLLNADEIEFLHNDRDPVLYCIYKVLDMDRMYFVQKCNEWMRACDLMYIEVSGGSLAGRGGGCAAVVDGCVWLV